MDKHALDMVKQSVVLRATRNLSAIGLPPVQFEYVDPIWVWIQQACAVGATSKLWFSDQHALKKKGRGCTVVEYSTAWPSSKCAPGMVPALFVIHFDKGQLSKFLL